MNLYPTLEALFFATDEPISLKRLCEILSDSTPDEVKSAVEAWKDSLAADEDRALQVVEVAGGYLLATKPEFNELLDRFLERKKKRTLSQAALETLAVIAYRQPVTRAEIEAVRGVNVDSMVHALLQRRLVKIAGRKDVPGNPFVYRTTKHFLHHFGLKGLNELPKIDELTQALAEAEVDTDEDGFSGPDHEGIRSLPIQAPGNEDLPDEETGELPPPEDS